MVFYLNYGQRIRFLKFNFRVYYYRSYFFIILFDFSSVYLSNNISVFFNSRWVSFFRHFFSNQTREQDVGLLKGDIVSYGVEYHR